ncbi:MAG: cation:proton antiporter, partial [Dyadobacter sp.]
ITYGIVISLIAIVIRLLYTFPIAYVPLWFGNTVRKDPANPPWKGPMIVGWAGMRGVVSLASALSVPLFLSSGVPFPHRNLILFITFIVILSTLVFQGLTLPLIIKWVKLKDIDDFPPEEEQEAAIHFHLMRAALEELNEKFAFEITDNELVGFLKNQLENDITLVHQRLESLECDDTEKEEIELYNSVRIQLFSVQRRKLIWLRNENLFSDEELRKHERQLDFEEAKIKMTGYNV